MALNLFNLNFIAILKIQYMAIALTAFLGVYAGLILSYIAPEELKAGKKYLMYLRDAVLLLTIFLIIARYSSYYLAIPTLLLMFPSIMFYRDHKNFDKFTHILLAAALILSAQFDFALFATLIFIYGAIISILFISQFEKKDKIAKKFSFIFFEVNRRYSWFLYVVIVFSIILMLA